MTELTVYYSRWAPPVIITAGMCDKCKGIFALSGFAESILQGQKLKCERCMRDE